MSNNKIQQESLKVAHTREEMLNDLYSECGSDEEWENHPFVKGTAANKTLDNLENHSSGYPFGFCRSTMLEDLEDTHMSNNEMTQTAMDLEEASKPSEFIELSPEHIEACKELHRKMSAISSATHEDHTYIYGWNRETFESVQKYVEERGPNDIPGCSCCWDEEDGGEYCEYCEYCEAF